MLTEAEMDFEAMTDALACEKARRESAEDRLEEQQAVCLRFQNAYYFLEGMLESSADKTIAEALKEAREMVKPPLRL